MTREEILNMQPGRELDELVMTNIFKARRAYYGEDELWYHYDENGKPDYEWSAYNSPSTSISAAWEVVEHLKKEHGLRLHLELHSDSGCYIWLENDMGGNVTGRYEFRNEIEGICKIALFAVMDKEAEA